MKIGIIAQGSNGDVEILVSLALGLARNNHDVELFIITINVRDYSFLNGIQGITLHQKYVHTLFKQHDREFWNKSEALQDEIFITLHLWIKDDLQQFAFKFAMEKDLVIGLPHLFELVCAAEKFNVPYISVNYHMEHMRTLTQPPFIFATRRDENIGLLWDEHERLHNEGFKIAINTYRQELGLSPIHLLEDIFCSKFLTIIPCSKYLYNLKPDWPKSYFLSGYMKPLNSYNEWNPTPHLLAFIEQDKKPIFITLGSMAEHENNLLDIQQLLLHTAHAVDRKVIILSDWQEDANTIDRNVYKLHGFVSFPKILNQCSVVVHHGGIGITHQATQAGCSSVVIKYGHDQPYNAKVLQDLGISNGSIYRKDLTAEALASLLNDALQDQDIKQKAEVLGASIQEEDGVAYAVEQIETNMKQFTRQQQT